MSSEKSQDLTIKIKITKDQFNILNTQKPCVLTISKSQIIPFDSEDKEQDVITIKLLKKEHKQLQKNMPDFEIKFTKKKINEIIIILTAFFNKHIESSSDKSVIESTISDIKKPRKSGIKIKKSDIKK